MANVTAHGVNINAWLLAVANRVLFLLIDSKADSLTRAKSRSFTILQWKGQVRDPQKPR